MLRRVLLALVRYGVAAGMVIAAFVTLAVGGVNDTTLEGAAGLAGAGLAVLLFSVLVRIGMAGEQDRDREDAARRYYDRHGRWPDDPPRHRR